MRNLHDTVFTRTLGSDSIRVVVKENVIDTWTTWLNPLCYCTRGDTTATIHTYALLDQVDIRGDTNDVDQDSVPDSVDDCPYVPGLPPDGCPIVIW